MATLKIDVVVDDHGAEAKLRQINAATDGVAGATAKATASIQSASAQSVSAFASMNNAAMGFFKTTASFLTSNTILKVADMIGSIASNSVRMAGTLVDLSAKTGLTTATLQRLGAAGAQAGVSMESFASAVFKVGVRIGKSNGKDGVASAVRELGLNLVELQSMSPDKMIETLLLSLSKVGDEQERNRLGVELFGRSFEGVSAAVTAGYEDIWKAARVSGDEQIKALDDAADAWELFTTNAQANLIGLLGTIVQVAQGARQIGFLESIRNAGGAAINAALHGATGPEQLLSAALGVRNAGTSAGLSAREAAFWANAEANPDVFAPGRTTNRPVKPTRDADAERALREAKREREQFQRAVDDMTGMSSIREADEQLRQLKAAGGLTKISADATKKLAANLDEAIDAYNRLGKQAPTALLQTWAALQKADMVGPGIVGLSQSTMDAEARRQEALRIGMSAGGPQMIKPGMIGSIGAESWESLLPVPSFMKRVFGGSGQFGGDLAGVLMSAITGGGNVGEAAGGFLGGGLFKDLAGSLTKKVGPMLGGIIGSVVPGLGTLLGSLGGGLIGKAIGGIGKLFGFGGGKEKKETIATRDQFIQQFGGIDKLKDTFAELGLSSDKFFNATKAKDLNKEIEKLNAGMEKQKSLQEGIAELTAGVNARAANVSTQGDVNAVSAGAVASFGLQLSQGTSAVEALSNLSAAIGAVRDATAGGNLEMTAAGQKLLELSAIVEANRVPFQNMAADGQILNGMMKGNIQDFDLFKQIASDIGVQMQGMIDRGVPTAQVLALAQPQLQTLWEAQQKYHFEVDATTQSLLNQAVQQGMVGDSMKSIQQQMLEATIGIRDALTAIGQQLGAIPAAARAAGDAMSGIQPNIYHDSGERPESTESFHSGGLIGWRRMHAGGLASDEVPIIGQRGEFMMSKRGVAANGLATLRRMNAGENVNGGIVFHPGSIQIGAVDSDERAVEVANKIAEAIRLNRGGTYQRFQAALGNA